VNEQIKVGDLSSALASVPVFPLSQAVLFPRATLALHVFEPRYRAMLKDAIAGNGYIVIALALDGEGIDAHGHPRIAPIAGVGAIVEHQMMADGRANIVLIGRGRVRIEELSFTGPYRRVRATLIEERPARTSQSERAALVTTAGAYASDVRRRDPKFSFAIPPNIDTPAIADLCAHHLLVDAKKRQAILEELDGDRRVRMVIRELASQHSIDVPEVGSVLH
jgi:Lon protease-like protein